MQFNNADSGFDFDRVLPAQTGFSHELCKCPCAVSALFDFTAIGIENAVFEIDFRIIRLLDEQNLIGTNAVASVGQKTIAPGSD